MRFVDLAKMRLPDGWTDRAKDAAKAVEGGDKPEDHAAVWQDLKGCLGDLLPEKKCWFCESEVDRADNAVDHFRPKNRVVDAAKPHDGYRWLAFEPSNFRYACTFCNCVRIDVGNGTRGGKADRFPLVDEEKRVYSPGPVDQEEPALLDPCRPLDWKLLGCKCENGKPCATSRADGDAARVKVSIEVFHLDYEPTCKRRHSAVVQLIANVDQAKRLFDGVQRGRATEAEFEAVACMVRRAIDRTAPFSGEMIFVLKGQRHADHPWIQDLLEA